MPWLGVTRVLHAGAGVWIALAEGVQGSVQRVDFRAETEVELSLRGVATEHQEVGAEAQLRDKRVGAGLKQAGEQGGEGFGDEGVFAGVQQVRERVWAGAILRPGQGGRDVPGGGQVSGKGVQDGLIKRVQLCAEFWAGNRGPGPGLRMWREGEMGGIDPELDVKWGGAQASGDRRLIKRQPLPELVWRKAQGAAWGGELEAGRGGEVPGVRVHQLEER